MGRTVYPLQTKRVASIERMVRSGRVYDSDNIFPSASLCFNGWSGCEVRSLCGGGCISPWHFLGPQELKCYNINHQEPTGEARIDERASLVVSFVVPHATPIPLRGLVDTGSGVSILTFSAFNRVAARTGTVLKPYQVDLYAANGKTIKTYGLAEHIHFQLGGYELETNFVVVDDAMGVEDFLLGRNFLRSYQVLVDLTSMKIVVRAPVKPVWHHAHAQVGDTSIATPVVLDSDLVLQPFERAVARAKLVTNALEPLIFQSVALNASSSDTTLHNVVFLEDSVATVSETGTLFVSLINLTCNPQRMRCGVQLGTVVPITVVYQAVPQCLDSPTTTAQKLTPTTVVQILFKKFIVK